MINSKLLENSQSEQLNFTTEDILLKRDMDFINKVKLPISYYAFNDNWNLLDRETKADIVMRYIDDIELVMNNNKYEIKQVNFRSTFYSDFEELYKQGYIDKKRPLTYNFNGICTDTIVRYSEYLPIKDVMQHLCRLNEYYEVNFYKGTLYKETEKLDMFPLQKNEVPIRIFPLQENNNGEKIEKYDDLIWANFKEVRCNTSIEENGKFSYVIICEWMNPLEQKSYLFTSENIWYNPEEIIHTYHLDTEPFPVYICRENLNEYRIDISVLEELKMTGK